MQVGFYFNQTRCAGCKACSVACKDWNNVDPGPENWMRILYKEDGEYPDIFVSYLISPCYECEDPVCIPVCPVNAITKRSEDGIVVVDSDVCLGNKKCEEKCKKACTYDAPQFDSGKGAKMRKCDFCLERHLQGKKPICVETCYTRAINSGILEDLKSKYGEIQETSGFKYSHRVKPAIIFKPKTM